MYRGCTRRVGTARRASGQHAGTLPLERDALEACQSSRLLVRCASRPSLGGSPIERVQPFEPRDDQRQIGLLSMRVLERVEELIGIELGIPEPLRPVPVDLATHEIAQKLADRAIACKSAEVS